MADMVEEIACRNEHIQRIVGTRQAIPVKAGFVAEELHGETFNLEAMLQNRTARLLTDRDQGWPLGTNHPSSDAIVVDGEKVLQHSQFKFFKNADKTANAMREVRPDGSQRYQDVDSFVGPSDQVYPADGTQSIHDRLRATQQRETANRPHVADAAEFVEQRVSDRVEYDGIESRPTSSSDTNSVAKDTEQGREIRNDYQNDYMTNSTVQQMGNAAAGAAAISAVIVGTLSATQYLKLFKEGRISKQQAVMGIVKTTAAASADSAIKAAAATGAVSVATRLAPELVARNAFQGLLVKGSIAGGAICAVDLIECIVLVAAGKMTAAQMETRVGKNVMQVAGASFGSSVGVSVAATMGATAGLAPILAGIAGAMIVGVGVNFAIDNGIEKPYREVMANTEVIVSASKAMKQCSEVMEYGQKAFVGFLMVDAELDSETVKQFKSLDQLGEAMDNSISQI